MNFEHFSVMLDECIEGLNISPDKIYLDGTTGGAGHSSAILSRLNAGKLIALDQDPYAIEVIANRLAQVETAGSYEIVESNFSRLDFVLESLDVPKVDGILLDLGVSSHQLDEKDRGFSYHKDAPLDMRMSSSGLSAKDVVNDYSAEELARILREYGEEQFAYKIAKNIVAKREQSPVNTTLELADIIRESVPAAKRREKNPCKKTFQAIRIEVNAELDSLRRGLEVGFESLNKNGRMVILTFHSLEDRIVKQFFASLCKGCTCPSEFPICVCENRPKAKLINRKPIVATNTELEQNRRSKSAKLRVLEKI